MVAYDIILGMDWLSKNYATIFRKKKKVVFQSSEEKTFEYKGTPRGSKWPVISVMKTSKMLTIGYVGYLASIIDMMKKVKTELSNVCVVYKFLNVFPKDFPGLSLDREIEFEIELLLGTVSISKVPYLMAPGGVERVKATVVRTIDKKFIRPSYFPW